MKKIGAKRWRHCRLLALQTLCEKLKKRKIIARTSVCPKYRNNVLKNDVNKLRARRLEPMFLRLILTNRKKH